MNTSPRPMKNPVAPLSQLPNYLAWDEETAGIPDYLLHVGAVQWF